MSLTVTMNAPPGFGGTITGSKSGIIYAVPSLGVVSVLQADLQTFYDLGFQPAPNTVISVGAAAPGVTAVEYGDAHNHTSILTLATVLPTIAGGASLGVGKLLYTLPAGSQIVTGAQINAAITQTQGHINADTPKVGLGSVIASGAVAVLNGTAAFMDILTQQTAADCNGTATVKTALATSSPFAFITEAGGSKAIYFNAAYAWAASGDAAALLTGTVVLNWRHMTNS